MFRSKKIPTSNTFNKSFYLLCNPPERALEWMSRDEWVYEWMNKYEWMNAADCLCQDIVDTWPGFHSAFQGCQT